MSGNPADGVRDVAPVPGATLSVADRLEITELLSRYAWAFDQRDGDSYADIFTENGQLQGPQTTIIGRDALRAWAADFPPATYHHSISNLVIEGSATEAVSRCYLMASQVDEHGIRPLLMGSYHDTLSKTADGWRIVHRRLVIEKRTP